MCDFVLKNIVLNVTAARWVPHVAQELLTRVTEF